MINPQNKRIVLKFGGGVLASPERIETVISAIKSYKKNTGVFAVVSAFYGITDKLLEAINTFKNKSNPYLKLKNVENICLSYIPENFENNYSNNVLHQDVKKYFKQLYDIFSDTKENLTESQECFVLSFGERISSMIVCKILNDNDLNFSLLFPEDYGFFAQGDCFNAIVDIEKSAESIEKKIDHDKNYLMPGFYAISDEGKINILGRGGSDYSASALAACLEAQTMDIWKDVGGFRTADPKIIKNTKKIDFLNYDEAAELSYFGATILHHQTVVPLYKNNIPIRIFDINEAESEEKSGTIINGDSSVHKRIIKSLTYSNEIGVLNIKGPQLGAKQGVLASITGNLSNRKINIKSVLSGQTEIKIIVSASDIHKALNIIEKSEIQGIEKIDTFTDVSLIALIGQGITKQYGIGTKIFKSLATAQINARMISFGASNVAGYFLVDTKDCIKALEVLHEDIVENGILES